MSFSQSTASFFAAERETSSLGTDFTYQGQLNQNGDSATGIYDFIFKLYSDENGENQVGADYSLDEVFVTDGLFTVQLDFGSGVFNGEPRWLEISVAANGASPQPLNPLQPLTAVPYALYGEDADADPANELQTLVITGTQLSLSNGGGSVDLPTSAADNLIFEISSTFISSQTGIAGTVDVITVPISFSEPFTESPTIFSNTPPQNLGVSHWFDNIDSDGATLNVSLAFPEADYQVVDGTGEVGDYVSMVIVNGKPAISYFDVSDEDLKYVQAADAEGTAWNAPVTIDSAGDVGEYTSLAVVDGNPAISYHDDGNGDLKYVRATNTDGTAWGTPITIDNTDDVGIHTTLVVVNGNPAISYHDETNLNLEFVRADDQTGSTWGTPITVDNGTDVGEDASLAIVNGNPAISYYDADNEDLKYVRANDQNGSSWGTPIIIDSDGDTGEFTSLTIVNGNPAISYHSDGEGTLLYVRASDTNGSSWGTPIILDNGSDLGEDTSMVIINGKPAISYFDNSDDDLKFVQAADVNGASWGNPLTLDSSGDVGKEPFLIEINESPAIGYFDDDNGFLKYVFLDVELSAHTISWMAIQP